MATNKSYYEERIDELYKELGEWSNNYLVKMINLAEEAVKENQRIAGKITELKARLAGNGTEEATIIEKEKPVVTAIPETKKNK